MELRRNEWRGDCLTRQIGCWIQDRGGVHGNRCHVNGGCCRPCERWIGIDVFTELADKSVHAFAIIRAWFWDASRRPFSARSIQANGIKCKHYCLSQSTSRPLPHIITIILRCLRYCHYWHCKDCQLIIRDTAHKKSKHYCRQTSKKGEQKSMQHQQSKQKLTDSWFR